MMPLVKKSEQTVHYCGFSTTNLLVYEYIQYRMTFVTKDGCLLLEIVDVDGYLTILCDTRTMFSVQRPFVAQPNIFGSSTEPVS